MTLSVVVSILIRFTKSTTRILRSAAARLHTVTVTAVRVKLQVESAAVFNFGTALYGPTGDM